MSAASQEPLPSRRSPPGVVVFVLGLCAVLAISSTIVFHRLGEASLFGDEAIYALTSRESVKRDTWLPLYKASGQLFPNKPPAKILLVSACFKYLGESEFSARLPDAVFGVLTVAGVFVFSARRFGVGTGLLAAAVLLGAQGYFCEHGVRDSVMDSMLGLLALGLCVAWINFREGGEYRQRWWVAAAGAVLLANITKNMLGGVFAMTVIGAECSMWALARRRPRTLFPAFGLLAVAAAGGVVYFAVMMLVTRGAFAPFLYRDIVVRASTGVDPVHLEGPFYYFSSLVQQFGWWLVLLAPAGWAVACRRGKEETAAPGFLVLWSIVLVAGFSLSVSKLPWYIYPAFPQLAVAIAFGAHETVRHLSLKLLRVAVIGAIVCAAAFDLMATWDVVQQDAMVVDEQRFVRAYSDFGSAALAIDAQSIENHGRLRSWSRFYLEGASNSYWFRRPPISFSDPPAECLFLATGEPRRYPPTPARPWRVNGRLHSLDALAAAIWIVGTCDLDLPWAEDRDEDFFEGLILADDFEGGTLSGFTLSDCLESGRSVADPL